MSKREIASLAFRVAGIYAIVQAIPHLQVVWYAAGAFFGRDTTFRLDWEGCLALLGSTLPLVLLVALGAFLWRHSGTLAERMFSSDDAGPGVATNARELQAIALSVLGTFVIVLAVPSLGAFLANLAVQSQAERLRISVWPPLIKFFLQLGIGLGLFFGAGQLARLWHKLRTAGVTCAVDETDRKTSSEETEV